MIFCYCLFVKCLVLVICLVDRLESGMCCVFVLEMRMLVMLMLLLLVLMMMIDVLVVVRFCVVDWVCLVGLLFVMVIWLLVMMMMSVVLVFEWLMIW